MSFDTALGFDPLHLNPRKPPVPSLTNSPRSSYSFVLGFFINHNQENMREIEVDDDVFALIQGEAEPLVDDANSSLRRLLGLDGGETGKRSTSETLARLKERRDVTMGRRKSGVVGAPRAPLGSLLPEEAYRGPILLELLKRGGTGSAKEITDAVGKRVVDELTDRDKEQLTSGDIRWRARVQFTRLRMKEDGLIKSGSKRGVWELSDTGRKVAKKLG
jgi:Mrr N-terminal domain